MALKTNIITKKVLVGILILIFLADYHLAIAAQCKIKVKDGSVSINLNEVMNCAEQRYGYDKDFLRRTQQKETAPEVSIFFDKSNPKEGEKVTATAVPKLFRNSNEELYYTWYILHADADGNILNSDDDSEMSDEISNGKREAMGRVARGSFDPVLFDVTEDDYQDEKDADDDKDGFIAPFGGINGVGAKEAPGGGYNPDENDVDKDGYEDDVDNCPVNYNPDQNDMDGDAASAGGDVCDDDLDGDGIGNTSDNCVQKNNPDQENEDSDSLGDYCDPNPSQDKNADDKDNDGIPADDDNCPNDANPNQQDEDGDGVGTECDNSDVLIVDNGSGESFEPGCGVNMYEKPSKEGVVNSACLSRCYKHNFGTKADVENVKANTSKDKYSGKDLIVECEHEFPQAKNVTIEVADGAGSSEEIDIECNDETIGDGDFDNNEEACWKLDPNNPDTDGDGVQDEMDLAGLNQQSFTWTYTPGDRVGVSVEGTSIIATNETEKNAYYKIMWARPGICSATDEDFLAGDDCDVWSTGEHNDRGFNYYATMEVSEEGTQNIDTALIYSPENVQFDFNDPDRSDPITVSAMTTNESSDERYVYYEWSVYRCGSQNGENCITNNTYDETDIPDIISDGEVDASEKSILRSTNVYLTENCQPGEDQSADLCGIETGNFTSGIGMNEFVFRPKQELMLFSKEYFKVVLKTKRDEKATRFSVSEILIPVTQNDIELELNTIEGTSVGSYTVGDEICEYVSGQTNLYYEVCPVYPNQVIAAKAIPRIEETQGAGSDDFEIESYSWELNGEPLNPPMTCPFDSCDMEDVVYFPVIGNDLDVGEITVTAKRKNGENLAAQRMFSINRPLVRIYSDDVSAAWYFEKEDGTESENVLETYDQNRVTFRADLIPDYLVLDENTYITWFINDIEITPEVAELDGPDIVLEDNKITYTAGGTPGTSSTIMARVDRKFTDDEIELLSSAWGINEVIDHSAESQVELKFQEMPVVIEPENETASLRLFFASTIQNAPKVIIFTLRMAIGLILIVSLLVGAGAMVRFRDE